MELLSLVLVATCAAFIYAWIKYVRTYQEYLGLQEDLNNQKIKYKQLKNEFSDRERELESYYSQLDSRREKESRQQEEALASETEKNQSYYKELKSYGSQFDKKIRQKESALKIRSDELSRREFAISQKEDEYYENIMAGPIQFEYEDSDRYKEALIKEREKQKILEKEKRALRQPVIELEDDARFDKKLARLVMIAYKSAADEARAKVRWNNYESIIKRFDKKREQINSLTPVKITIAFHQLKIREITYTHHRDELLKIEKEENKATNAQLREEAKQEAKREQEIKDASREEEIAKRAVKQTTALLEKSFGDERYKYEAQLELLQDQLQEAQAKNERAMSMAQQTRMGHIYIASNIGCFGENVYKVGMTRRLQPYDRITELSDASVPFNFDTHAMIQVDDAPGVEKILHKALESARVNKVNRRREFFEVTLQEIKSLLKTHLPDAEFEFYDKAEAREYYESLAYSETAITTTLETVH